MDREFKGKAYWAVILGGSSGLGLASAKKLARHGMNICIVHRDPRIQMKEIGEHFQEIQDLGVRFVSYNVDAVNPAKMEDVLIGLREQIGSGKVRCLLHSISKGNLKPMVNPDKPELEKLDFMLTLDSMAISLYQWTKALYDSHLFAIDARVLSFTSEGNKRVYAGYGAVSVAKVALEAITRNIAVEFAPYGIRANCIQAGVTPTRSQQMIPESEKMVEGSKFRNPFGRITVPQDVANVVYLLCKDEAAWINGTLIVADGGESIH